MDKCIVCRQIIKGSIYSCCRQNRLYCSTCKPNFCKICLKSPKIRANATQKELNRSRFFQTCNGCKKTESLSMYQYFHQQKCKYDFCYKCLIGFYQKHLLTLKQIESQQGVRPDFPVQLPCGCEITQNEILLFLQRSCYCCSKKIQDNVSYRLSNNMRIMKKCLKQLQTVALIGRYRATSQKWKQINKMLLRCEGCDSVLSQQLSNQQKLNVCKQCLQHNRRQVKMLQKEQEINVQKQVQDMDVQVKLEKSKKNMKKLEVLSIRKVIKSKKVQEIKNEKKLSESQKEIAIKQQIEIQQQQIIPKQVDEQDSRPMLQEKLELKTIKPDEKMLLNLKQCNYCLLLMPEQDIKLLSQQNRELMKLRVPEKEKNNCEKNEQKQNICNLCYLQSKYKQRAQRQRKVQQKLDRSRLYKSTHKNQKTSENKSNNRARIFDYNQYGLSPLTKFQAPKPNSDKKPLTISSFPSTSNYLYQRCNQCSKLILSNISKLCRDCENKTLEKIKTEQKGIQTFCRLCKKPKKQLQSEFGLFNYCKQCSMKVFRPSLTDNL